MNLDAETTTTAPLPVLQREVQSLRSQADWCESEATSAAANAARSTEYAATQRAEAAELRALADRIAALD